MEEMVCPRCRGAMVERAFAYLVVLRCTGCQGVFLERADLGALVEAENDWHAHQSANTAALPRITADAPPPRRTERSRAFVETLFTG